MNSKEPSGQKQPVAETFSSFGGRLASMWRSTPRQRLYLIALLLGVVLATFAVTWLLITIFEHRQAARRPFVRLVEVDETTTNPVPWGINWPSQFDTYRRTVDVTHTQYGGSDAMPESKLDQQPWLRRLYAGYAFSIDHREARGHAYMLYDQEVTERVTKRSQSGSCLHCHASVIPTYRRLGLEAAGLPADAEALGAEFNWPAVMEGFEIAAKMDYATAHAAMLRTPDGTAGDQPVLFPGGTQAVATPAGEDASGSDLDLEDPHLGRAHPVSCVDCHDPQTMQIRITRPGFVLGIAALARSDDPVPHLPSIARWRDGRRLEDYDPNREASRQEMRSFVCAQCHVEYYCASKDSLFFPWHNGLKAEQIEQTFDEYVFPDGAPFYDYMHAETGAPIYKAQHPEFELWSQGIHAANGVTCSDCHMPYERQGAMKVSSHWVRSPMLNINRSCQVCHQVPEDELRNRVQTIQARTKAVKERAADAMTDMLDAILEAQAAGASSEQLAPILELQRKAMWRLDFISSENSRGFHASQEAVRLLGESIDYSRQASVLSLRLRAPKPPPIERREDAVEGVTPAEKAPPSPN
jgi:nitrite reductase (cytochrome c-552)